MRRPNGRAPLEVQVHWDAEASIWWLQSDDLPGLATEAPSLYQLIEHIKSLVPVIMRENLEREPGGISVHLTGDTSEETLRING